MAKGDLKRFVEKYPFTTGVIRKTSIDLTSDFIDKRITIAGWQTILANNNFAVCSHLTYKIHSQNNAAIPLLPFCSIEDKWIKEIYLTNDLAQPGVSVDFIIVNPPTKLNYTGIYSQTIDTEGSITAILQEIKYNTGNKNTSRGYFDSITSGTKFYSLLYDAYKLQVLKIIFDAATTDISFKLKYKDDQDIFILGCPDLTAAGIVTFGIGLYPTTNENILTLPLPDIWLKGTPEIEFYLYFTGGGVTSIHLNQLIPL